MSSFSNTIQQARSKQGETANLQKPFLESDILAATVSRDGTIVYITDELATLTGWKPNELTGKNVVDTFYSTQEQPLKIEQFTALSQHPNLFNAFNTQVVHKGGQRIDIKLNAIGIESHLRTPSLLC